MIISYIEWIHYSKRFFKVLVAFSYLETIYWSLWLVLLERGHGVKVGKEGFD